MQRKNINYLAVGFLVIAMGISLMVVLFELTGRSENTDTYYVVFNNITNIQDGSTVTYSGYPLGYVKSIEPQRTSGMTRYRLALALKQEWQIPTDSYARIYTPGMLADTMIDIVEGQQVNILSPGDTIDSRETPDLMTILGETADEIKNLSSNDVQPLIANLNDMVSRIGNRMDTSITDISNETLNLLNRLDSLSSTMDKNMQLLSKDTGTLLTSLQQNSDQLSRMLNSENTERISNMLENADNMSEELANTMKELSNTREALNRVLKESASFIQENKSDINAAINEARHTVETISNNIDSIVYQLDSTSRNMNEFSRRIRNNPGALIQDRPPEDVAE